MAAPTVIGTISGGRNGAGTVAITPPAGSSSYLAMVTVTGFVLTPPSGWTLVRQDNFTGGPTNGSTRLYKGSSSAGSTWTTALDGSGEPTVLSVVITGYSQDVTIGGLAEAASLTAPTITIPSGSEAIIAYGIGDLNDTESGSITYPTGTSSTAQRIQASGVGFGGAAAMAHRGPYTGPLTVGGGPAFAIPSSWQPKSYAAYLTGPIPMPNPATGVEVMSVAHHDDQGFIAPDVISDHDSGTPIVYVCITAGDNNAGWGTFAQNREKGAKASFASLAGVSSPTWLESTRVIAGKTIAYSHMVEGNIRLYWLRLPDTGNGFAAAGNIWALWEGTSTSLASRDTSQTFTKSELISVLAGIIDLHQAARVSHLLHREDGRDGDHPDHAASGRFTRAAVAASTTKPPVRAYLGEHMQGLPANLSIPWPARKESADRAYAAQTGDTVDSNWARYWSRKYQVQEQSVIDPLPAATATIFGTATPSGSNTLTPSTDSNPVVCATAVRVSAGSGQIVSLGARFFLPSTTDAAAEGVGYLAHLWRASSYGAIDEWVASAVFGSVVRGAWQSVQWRQPVVLEPGASYYIAVTFPRGRRPAAVGRLAGALSVTSADNARISAPSDTDVRQGMFRAVATGAEEASRGFPPDNYANGSWYGIDGTFGVLPPVVPPLRLGGRALTDATVEIGGATYRLKRVIYMPAP